MARMQNVAVSRNQIRQMLGAITHETMYESAKHRKYICGDPVRRGVDGWPLLGRCTSALKAAAFLVCGERGRTALETKETLRRRELKEVVPGREDSVEHWRPSSTPHWKRDPRVCLPDIWGAVSTASANLQNGQSGEVEFRMAQTGRPGDLASTLCDPSLPEGVAIGPGQASVLARELKDMEAIRRLRFIVNPAQIGSFSDGPMARRRSSLMETAFARSQTLQDEAYMFFARQLARGNTRAQEFMNHAEHCATGKYAFDEVRKICAPRTPVEQLKFDGVIVLDTKHRISENFYYAMHAITDYYGGLFQYWFNRFMDGKLDEIPKADYAQEFAGIARRKAELRAGFWGNRARKALGKEEKRLKELAAPARLKKAADALNLVRKKSSALLGFYEIQPGRVPNPTDIYHYKCPLIRLDENLIPDSVHGVLEKLRQAYAKTMLPNRFYMQNLSTLKESLLSILAGLGAVKLFEKVALRISHKAEIFLAPFGEVLANLLNGIADMLSGAVTKGPQDEGDEQAKAEHASKGALKWGLIGGFLTSCANTLTLSHCRYTMFARLMQSFLHALSGNFTTQTVSQVGVWGGLFRKTGTVLQRVGVVDEKVNAPWESFKEVNINNIFRLWQTVIGSVFLWTSTFVIGTMGIIENPSKAGMFGGMLLFLTAVLETPLAAVGIGLNPLMNKRKNEKEMLRTLMAAEAAEKDARDRQV